jgi:hypothetical protein
MRLGVIILASLFLLPAAAWADVAPEPGPCFNPGPPGPHPRTFPSSQPSSRPATHSAVASMPLSLVAGGLLASSALIGGGLLLSRRRRGH